MSFSNKKLLATVITTLVVIVIALGTLFGYKAYINSKVEAGEKKISVHVVIDTEDESYEKIHTFWTEAEFLGDALIEEEIVEAEDSNWGRFIISVDGYEADSTNEEWWKILQNDEMANVGMDDLTIKHGDEITIVLIVGYDS